MDGTGGSCRFKLDLTQPFSVVIYSYKIILRFETGLAVWHVSLSPYTHLVVS